MKAELVGNVVRWAIENPEAAVKAGAWGAGIYFGAKFIEKLFKG
jgi:hypothetical protein